MNETKFNALIQLLDDTDPYVSESVEKELFTLGTQGINRLESAWEMTGDSAIQNRLEEVINKIQVAHFTKELLIWRKGGGEDLFDGWLLLTQMKYPTLNVKEYKNKLNRLINKIWLKFTYQMEDIEKLFAINRELYRNEGFRGNFELPEKPENNYLNCFLDSRLGNSLSMAAFYYMICKSLGIELQVVNFMGYYSLRYISRDRHFYIDTYNNGIFFEPEQVEQFLRKLNAEQNVLSYKHMTNIYIVLHLIQHLVTGYRSQGLESKAEMYEQVLRDIEIKFGG